MTHLEAAWQSPDEGIWEVRGPARHFTHSKVMAWVAFDRAVKTIEQFGLDGPLARWRAVRDRIHDEVCRHGYSAERGCFVQSYGSREMDAALLMLPLVGFLPASDLRIQRTVRAIEDDLLADGLVRRYRTEAVTDGLPAGEGVFLACSFWYVDNLVLQGRHDEAGRCSPSCSRCATTWACWPRNTIPARAACSATSRRRSRISRW